MKSPAFILFPFFLGACADAKEYRLKVGPLEEDLAAAVLSADVPFSDKLGPSAALFEDGKPVPVQTEPVRGGCRVEWIAGDLKKGSSAEWTLRLSDPGKEEASPPAGLAVRPLEGGTIAVEVGGKPFTKLHAGPEDRKPYLYPILLDGVPLTRHYPMEDFPGEDRDHIHQRSLWFTHGSVNGVDFWSEGKSSGKILQSALRASAGGPVFARIVTENEWRGLDDKKLLDDERTYRFYDLGAAGRLIDISIVLTARDEPVTFGDTKEGTFGIRLAESMKEARGGRIENSRGQVTEKKAWGKPAEWVDCSGKIGDRTYGIAILDHPSSFRHPTTWHVRGYGLFAANPFGLKDFTGQKEKDGSHSLEKGGSVIFSYRVFLHPGSLAEAKVAAAWRAFARPPEVKVEEVR